MRSRLSGGVLAAVLMAHGVMIATAQVGGAQSIAISGSSSLRYIELRALATDSVAIDEAPGDGVLRQLPDGRIVRCVPGDAVCRFMRTGGRESTVPMINDLEVSAWGFGEGVRLFSQLRSRTAWGSAPELWPRSDVVLEVLAAYAELVRERFRVRLGRQWQISGLGFYNFDGATVAVRPVRTLWVEAYGGRSLIRGLDEPRTGGALEAVEALAPPRDGVLLGGRARFRPTLRLALSATYQVDFRGDSAGLYSELATANGSYQLGVGGAVEGSMEVDIATSALHEARVALTAPPWRRIAVRAELMRYRPVFELWTIWGAFSPVGYDEARGGVTWAGNGGRLMVRADAFSRRYEDAATDDGPGGSTFRDGGWGVEGSGSWAPSPIWRFEGSYGVETGFGAARRDGQATVVRRLGDRGTVAVQGLAFQRLYEFRLDEGTVVGLGGETSLRLSDRVSLGAAFTAYRHLNAGPASSVDWSQRRGSLRLSWTAGAEPVARPRPGRHP